MKTAIALAAAALLALPLAPGCTAGGGTQPDGGNPDVTVNPCGPGTITMCGDTCVDTQSDWQNCGSCGNACTSDKVCSHGQCAVVCGGGSSRCGNNCVDLKADPQNCGGCGTKCPGGEVCNKASCELTCQTGLTDCNGGCVDTLTDDANCGGCGNACPTGKACVNGACAATCSSPWTSCPDGDGGTTCVDVKNDPNNCNACGNPCPQGYFCNNGACGIQCAGGTTNCSNQCVDESIDPSHCGGCSTVCAVGNTCSNAHCCPSTTPYYCPAESACDTLANCVLKSGGAITAGNSHSCAINSSGALKCWGYNGDGELGVGTTTSYYNTAQSVLTLTSGVAAVAAWYDGTCATTLSGNAWCWGYNFYGQLGNNSTTTSTSPVQVSGISNAVLPAGGDYWGGNCVLLKTGGVDCWGQDEYGEIGLGSITSLDYTTPQVSKVTNALTISGTALAFDSPRCAVLAGGSVVCWGYGYYTLGDGITYESGAPLTVTGVTNAAQVAAGYQNVCIVTTGGALKCWGYNYYGQNGDGTTTTTYKIGNAATVTGVVQACVGYEHTCVVTGGGAVECVGYNGYGQLGNNSTTSSTTWVTAIPSGAINVACGEYHTCALLSNGKAECWGYNGDGQLGDGSYTERTAPVVVSGF